MKNMKNMKNMYPRICRQCGITFTGGPRAWYCPDCRRIREKERKQKYNKYGFERHIGDKDICLRCGKLYIITGGLQKYCPACSEVVIADIDRRQGIEWYHKNSDYYNAVRNEKRRKSEPKVCIICGKSFHADGKSRSLCSEECRQERRRQNQRKADSKRKRSNRNKKSTD